MIHPDLICTQIWLGLYIFCSINNIDITTHQCTSCWWILFVEYLLSALGPQADLYPYYATLKIVFVTDWKPLPHKTPYLPPSRSWSNFQNSRNKHHFWGMIIGSLGERQVKLILMERYCWASKWHWAEVKVQQKWFCFLTPMGGWNVRRSFLLLPRIQACLF